MYKAFASLTDPSLGVNDWVGLALEAGQGQPARDGAARRGQHRRVRRTRRRPPVPLGHRPDKAILVSGHDLHDLAVLLEQTEGTGHRRLHARRDAAGARLSGAQEVLAPLRPLRHGLAEPAQRVRRVPRRDPHDHELHPGAQGELHRQHLHDGQRGVARRHARRQRRLPGRHRRALWSCPGSPTRPTAARCSSASAARPCWASRRRSSTRSRAARSSTSSSSAAATAPSRAAATTRDFVDATPDDTVVLTLACGKFRFFDHELGDIGGIPRLLDVGQCNDAYSAVRIALALADAFDTDVNDLPLTLVLSWYEQKAVAILLTLLYLGIKDIRIGPSLPAFMTPERAAGARGQLQPDAHRRLGRGRSRRDARRRGELARSEGPSGPLVRGSARPVGVLADADARTREQARAPMSHQAPGDPAGTVGWIPVKGIQERSPGA